MPDRHRKSIETLQARGAEALLPDWYRPDLMAVIAVGDFDKAEVEKLIKEHFGGIPAPVDRRGRGPSSTCPIIPDTLFAVATDTEATMTTVGVYNMLPAARSDDGRRLPAAAGRAALHRHDERAARRADLQARSAVHAGRHRARHLRADEGSGHARWRWSTTTGSSAASTALVTESARAARVRLHRDRARAREARDAARLRERVRRARQGGVGRPGRRVHPQLTRRTSRCPASRTSTASCSASCPRSRSTKSTRSRRSGPSGSRVVLVERPAEARPDGARRDAKLAAVDRSRRSTRDITPLRGRRRRRSRCSPRCPRRARSWTATTRAEFGLTEWELSNGVRVVLKPTTFKQDEVIFRATSPGGTSLASDEDYVAAMTASQVVGAGGLGPFDVDPAPERAGRQGRLGLALHRRRRGGPGAAARRPRTSRRCSS